MTGVVVKQKIKEIAGDFSVSSDFADKRNSKVTELILEACRRAKENNRHTVMAKDL